MSYQSYLSCFFRQLRMYVLLKVSNCTFELWKYDNESSIMYENTSRDCCVEAVVFTPISVKIESHMHLGPALSSGGRIIKTVFVQKVKDYNGVSPHFSPLILNYT